MTAEFVMKCLNGQ